MERQEVECSGWPDETGIHNLALDHTIGVSLPRLSICLNNHIEDPKNASCTLRFTLRLRSSTSTGLNESLSAVEHFRDPVAS